MSTIIICKNCNKHYHGNYCPNCGQSAHIERVDYKYFIHDIPHSVFHVDKGFLYTLKELFTRPGDTIKEYLAGKRVNHFRPFAFVIILSTLSTILIPLIDKGALHIIYSDNYLEVKEKFKPLFWEKYISLLIFILIPLISIVTFITYKDRKYNYWEHLLGNTYVAALLNALLVVYKLFGLAKLSLGGEYSTNIGIFMFAFMFYYSYAFRRWMRPAKNFWNEFFRLLFMNTIISLIYITALSVTKIITPWWDF